MFSPNVEATAASTDVLLGCTLSMYFLSVDESLTSTNLDVLMVSSPNPDFIQQSERMTHKKYSKIVN